MKAYLLGCMMNLMRINLMNLTENEYNLVVYCLEQQMYEFNKDGQNDANNIVIKLSNLVESK